MRVPIFVHLAFFLVLTGWAPLSLGETLYVHGTNGDDRNSGKVPDYRGEKLGPLRTIAEASRRLPTGGRIVLLPSLEPYREEVRIGPTRSRDAFGQPLVIEANGAELVGTVATDWLDWRRIGPRLYEYGEDERTFGSLWLGDRLVPRSDAPMWGRLGELAPESYVIHRGRFVVRLAEGAGIHDYRFAVSQRRCGIFVYRGGSVVVRNARVIGYALDSVQARGWESQLILERCELVGPGRAAVSAYDGATVIARECRIETPRTTSGLARDLATVKLENCQLVGSARPVTERFGGTVTIEGSLERFEFGPPFRPGLPVGWEGTGSEVEVDPPPAPRTEAAEPLKPTESDEPGNNVPPGSLFD